MTAPSYMAAVLSDLNDALIHLDKARAAGELDGDRFTTYSCAVGDLRSYIEHREAWPQAEEQGGPR